MEFLVRVKPKPPAPGIEHKRIRVGDVVVMFPDGWAWGKDERTLPDWRIVRVPVTAAEAEAFLSSEPGDPKTNPLRRRRMFTLDFSLLPTAIRNRLNGTRNPANEPIDVSLAQLRAIKKAWPIPENTSVIGGAGEVIG